MPQGRLYATVTQKFGDHRHTVIQGEKAVGHGVADQMRVESGLSGSPRYAIKNLSQTATVHWAIFVTV
jgi:hypothetical protein